MNNRFYDYHLGRRMGMSSVWLGLTLAVWTASGAEEAAPVVAPPVIPPNVVRLTECGGVGDGVTLNTAAFARAVAKLSAQGGGELDVPPGLWLTGPIALASRLNLHLERGALVQFSRDYRQYPLTMVHRKNEGEVDCVSPILGENLTDIAITGEGIFDGGGEAWRPLKRGKVGESDWKALVRSGGVVDAKGDTWYPSPVVMNAEGVIARLRATGDLKLADYEPYHQALRPRMLELISCQRVWLQGVTFQNPPNWTMNPALCEDVLIDGVMVHNLPTAQNSDALDLESCRRAIVRNCNFDTGDDGICIKSGKDAEGRRIGMPTEDVLVEGCTVYHAHGGFTIGSEMSGGVRHVRVRNCTFIGTEVGLRFKSTRGRGGVVEDIHINDVRMENIVGNAIDFNLFYGGKSALEKRGGADGERDVVPKADAGTPEFRDIHISDVRCIGAGGAIVLQGLPEMPLKNTTLERVTIVAEKGVAVVDAAGVIFRSVQVTSAEGPALRTVRVSNSRLQLNGAAASLPTGQNKLP